MQLTVLTDRAQGGSSLKDGELELMVSYATPHHLPLVCHGLTAPRKECTVLTQMLSFHLPSLG